MKKQTIRGMAVLAVVLVSGAVGCGPVGGGEDVGNWKANQFGVPLGGGGSVGGSGGGVGGSGGGVGGSGGGVGGSGGGVGGSGGGPVECWDVADCNALSSECKAVACVANTCQISNLPDGTPTPSGQVEGDCKLQVCDGAGAMKLVDDNDPSSDDNPCTEDTCSGGMSVSVPVGGACNTGGGIVCGDPLGNAAGQCVQCNSDGECAGLQFCDVTNGSNVCVDATCFDLVKNGLETDVDCGGTCSPCGIGQGCAGGQNCQTGYCLDSVCSFCEADANCPAASFCSLPTGGICTPDQPNGAACSTGASCSSNLCVDGVCCGSPCQGQCQQCNQAGSLGVCTNVQNGQDPSNECVGGYQCNGNGACETCGDGLLQASEVCDDGNAVNGDGCENCQPGFVCTGNVCLASLVGGDCNVTQCQDNSTLNCNATSCDLSAGEYAQATCTANQNCSISGFRSLSVNCTAATCSLSYNQFFGAFDNFFGGSCQGGFCTINTDQPFVTNLQCKSLGCRLYSSDAAPGFNCPDPVTGLLRPITQCPSAGFTKQFVCGNAVCL